MIDVSWLHEPLFVNAGGHRVTVGIDAERSWYVDADDPVRADSVQGGVRLLPLMQPGYGGDLPTVRRKVAEALEATGLDRALTDTFPFHAPVLVAFESMAGWTSWAIEWLGDIELPERADPLLRAAIGNKAISQAIRHRVRTFLARRSRP